MSSQPGLHVDVSARRGAFTLDVQFDLPAGQLLAVLGPNGSGKSTLLDVLAGLLAPHRGAVTWRGKALSTAGSRPVPPASRRVGLLRQDPLLFPHLSVRENVAFGLRARRDRDALKRADEWLARLGVDEFAARRPRQLSGGQSARVAIARALAAEPQVLLLDEPLAALDATAPELRHLLGEIIRETGVTTVLVSHAVLDAALLADRVAVFHEGQVVEEGTRESVLSSPRTDFTAAFVGVNLVPAGFGGLQPAQPGTEQVTRLRFRPAAVVLSKTPPPGPNSWEVTVRWLEPATGGVRVRLATPGQPDVLADVDAADVAHLRPGAALWAHVPPGEVHPL